MLRISVRREELTFLKKLLPRMRVSDCTGSHTEYYIVNI